MSRSSEQILIIHSVNGTSSDDLKAAQDAISRFSTTTNRDVRVDSRVFEIPHGAAPGATLSTELSEELMASIGAVVFVDDLRPNVAYEMGFFHGQGRTVLLLTRKPIDSIWATISDLAGAALASLDNEDMETVISLYLRRLYVDISHVKMRSSFPLPSDETNLFNKLQLPENELTDIVDGPYGKSLIVKSWHHTDIGIGQNLLQGAKFVLLFRATDASADYTVYFRVRYSHRRERRKIIWLGLSSAYRAAGLTYAERTFPAQSATPEWRVLPADFDELLKQGFVLGSCAVDYIEKVRFRAGNRGEHTSNPVEFAYMSIIGIA